MKISCHKMLPIELNSERFVLKPYRKEDEDSYLEIAMDSVSITFMGGITGLETDERNLFRKIFDLYDRDQERIFWIWGIYKYDTLYGHLE